MIPVDQVRTGNPMGQCTEASLASVLEVPLEAVPELWDGPDAEEPRPLHRWIRMLGFVMAHGHQWVTLNFEARPIEHLELDDLHLSGLVRERLEDYHLIGGYNPDDIGHMVVGQAGRMVHDPNPLRRGLVTVDELVALIPLERCGDLMHWPMRHYRLVDGEWVLTTSEGS